MFSGAATEELLPRYVAYKVPNLWNTCMIGGTSGTCYNNFKSGWFDAICFDNWFHTITLPWTRRKEVLKLLQEITYPVVFALLLLIFVNRISLVLFAWRLTVPSEIFKAFGRPV